MKCSTLFLVLTIFGFGSDCHQAPASTKNYELGTVYSYDYTLQLEMSEPTENVPNAAPVSTVGYKIITKVEIQPVWEKGSDSLVQIKLVNPRLQIKSAKSPEPEGFRDHSSELDNAKLQPLFVLLKEGMVQSVHSVKEDDPSLLNVKKGIANILQIQPTEDNVKTSEATPAGKCSVHYKVQDGFQLTKIITESCDASGSFPGQKGSSNPVLGSDQESQIVSRVSMSRDAGVIGEVHVEERHAVRVTVKREVGAVVKASQEFKLAGTTSSSFKLSGESLTTALKSAESSNKVVLVEDALLSKWEKSPYCEAPNCKTVDVLSQSLNSKNMATTKMASAFLQLVAKFRESKGFEEIKPSLKPKSKIFPQILDIAAATGSLDIHQAVMKTLKFQKEDAISLPERYLLSLSLSSSPTPEILQDLFKFLKSQKIPSAKLRESLLLTVSSMAHTISLTSQAHLLTEIESHILSSLAACSDPACRQLYLRALRNLKAPSTLPVLFQHLDDSDPKIGVEAMKSIHALTSRKTLSHLQTYKGALSRVICQSGRKRYDSSVRTLALDIFLKLNPSGEELCQVVDFLLEKITEKEHAEVTTFMWHRVEEFLEEDDFLPKEKRGDLLQCVKKGGKSTYHHLSPKGLSTAFTRYFTENSSFSNAIEMSGKILKRSAFDVKVKGGSGQGGVVDLLKLGIFADGLGSFADEEAEEEEGVEATAGMELTLLGVQTRPLVFFEGKGELMGLVWSGAGSDRTSAVQGNVLLQDEKKVVPLFNGLVAEVTILGGLSYDLAGQVELSLWQRTANSLVENKAGLVLQSVVKADTSFVKSRVDYTLASEAALHFTSDINFYQGVMMCLKLTQPEFKIRQNIHKTERIPGSKHKVRKAKYITTPVSGVTYALNKKNSELCSVMYNKKDEF